MIKQFSYLSKKEEALLLDAPVLITILVASSDEGIDRKEIHRGLDLLKWKRIHARPDLHDYYQEVNKHFSSRMDALLAELPSETKKRHQEIGQRLVGLNQIFPKFDRGFAEQLYASYRELAKNVAEASGGFLGYLSINIKESDLIKLPMIDDPRTYNV